MNNIVNVLTAAGKDVIDFSLRGWRPNKANIDKVASSIAALKLSVSDTVFLDLCLNSAIMGTDSNGLPAATEKLPVDGKYRITSVGTFKRAPSRILQNSQRLYFNL